MNSPDGATGEADIVPRRIASMASASFEVQEPRIGGGVGVALRNVACVAPAASPASAPPPSSPCAPAHSGGALGMSYTACHAGPWTERVFETRNSAGCTRVPSRSQTSYTNAERWPVRMIMMEGRRQSLPATARHLRSTYMPPWVRDSASSMRLETHDRR